MTQSASEKQAGQYYLIEKIAQGGMAEIYKGLAYDVNGLKRTVCIKKILPHISASPEFIDTLVNEAKIAVKLSHGNIAQTYDLGKVGNDYFMVMEYVHGKSLSQVAKRAKQMGEPVPLPLLTYIAAEVANGLDYMHRRSDDQGNPLNIVHRDISPQNILISYSGTIKLIDFGIALAANRLGFTEAGILKGKFSFMSPEQARGENLDHRSDIFSLGVVIHEALTEQRLFKADDNRETIRNVRKAHVVPPSTLNSAIPEAFDKICMRALAKDRRHRYTTAAEMRDELNKLLYKEYPNFQAADLAKYMHHLFPEEVERPVLEKELTPHLIIEGTESALANDNKPENEATSVAPQALNLSEYFLDDDKEELTPEEKSLSISESASLDELTSQTQSFRQKKWWALAALSCVALFIWWLNASKSSEELPLPELSVNTAELFVMSTPSDAEIKLNGKSYGNSSPVHIPDLKPEITYTLSVEKPGFAPFQKEFQPQAGNLLRENVTLRKILPQSGNLSVRSFPTGAKIFLDEQETKLTTPAEIPNLKLGKHSIGLFLANHKFMRKEIELIDENAKIEMKLEKDFGSLFISSQPAKALVVLNGKPVGETPLRLEKMEPEQVYHLEIWTEGYERELRDVKAIAGREQQINLNLERLKLKP